MLLQIPLFDKLSRLPRLCEVRLNLCITYGDSSGLSEREFEHWFRAGSQTTAEKVVVMLGPTVTLLSLLMPRSTGAQWVQYEISTTQASGRVVRETRNERVRPRNILDMTTLTFSQYFIF